MSELVSSSVGEALSRAIDWGKAKISDYNRQKAIKELLDQTRMRAAMTRSSINLAAKFEDNNLVEELLAHHELMDITKTEIIARFLGDDHDEAATIFIGEFYDALGDITDIKETSLAGRKTLETSEEICSKVGEIHQELARTVADEGAQIALLEEILKIVEAERISVDRIHELAKTADGSVASAYLAAYYALCTGGSVSFAALQPIKGNDALAFGLASIALSARRADDVVSALKLCSSDASGVAAAALKLLEGPKQISEPVEAVVPAGSGTAFVELISFEYFYGLGAFQSANDLSESTDIAWNPIAAEERELSRLGAACLINSPEIPDMTFMAIKRYRQWFPKRFINQLKTALSVALSTLSDEQAAAMIEAMPEELQEFAQDEEKERALMTCTNVACASRIMTWAEAKRNHVLLIDASIKMMGLDESRRREIVEAFERCKAWAFPTAGALDVYVSRIEPRITYEKLLDYGRGLEDEATFHLTAYKTQKDTNPEIAKHHIERAIELMKSTSGELDLLNSSTWVPYLVKNERSEELKDLVKEVLPIAPREYILPFFSAVASCQDSDALLNNLVYSMMNSDFRDPRTAEIIARHLSSTGQTELAGRVALAAFKKAPSETLAGIAAQWMSKSSIGIDDDIVRYAERADTAQMNLLIANHADDNGMRQKRDTYLIRAAFGGGEISSRALGFYAIRNAGSKETDKTPSEIGPDTYATLLSDDGRERTLVFLSDREAVKSEGAEGPAGMVFSVQSDEFLQCRGLHVGNSSSLEGEGFSITEVGAAETILMRTGFRQLSNSPGSTTFTGSPEELFEKIGELAKANASRIERYKNGVETESGTLYFGIETGNVIGLSRQLEFTVGAICNSDLPYRKHPLSRNSPMSSDSRFLLSYNALVILALLSPAKEVICAIQERCVVTESTAKRLEKDARALADEPYNGTGKLGHDGDHPVLYEYNDESKRYVKEKSTPILNLVERVAAIAPSLSSSSSELENVLTDNEVVDIQTAADNELVYVTEDILEAELIDAIASTRRCSIALMLLCLGCFDYVAKDYLNKMTEWGAEPILEVDIVELFRDAIREASTKYGIEIEPANEVDGEQS